MNPINELLNQFEISGDAFTVPSDKKTASVSGSDNSLDISTGTKEKTMYRRGIQTSSDG